MPTDILRARARRPVTGSGSGPKREDAERIVLIKIGRVELRARLAATPTADRLWAALPVFGTAEPWGEAVHFEVPVASGRDRTARVNAQRGDICFWAEEKRLIIAYGPTPISRPNEMRMPSPVNVVAAALDDVGVLRGARVGEKVSIVKQPAAD